MENPDTEQLDEAAQEEAADAHKAEAEPPQNEIAPGNGADGALPKVG